MKNHHTLFWSLVVLFSLWLGTSCQREIDLTADYKDISFSYAILDCQDSLHYFKIYKGYLTNENAFVQATDWNNIYYPVDSVEVRLEEYNAAHTLLRSQVLDTTTAIPKEDGIFASPKQLLYYSDWTLNKDYTYRLVIHHKNTGEEVYAETPIVHPFSVRRPTTTWNMNLMQPYSIQFYQSDNAAAYDILFTFAYIEVNNTTGAIEHKSFTRRLNSDLIRTPSAAGLVSYSSFTPHDFYLYLAQYIPENPNVTRYIDAIDGQPYRCIRLSVWAASQEYLYYQQVSTPSSSIVDNRLEYTNFVSTDNDAYGLLASRTSTHVDLMLDISQAHNEDTLVLGPITRHLNFGYYRNSPLFPHE
ncbi:MAG: hypothetical protein IKU03_09025 [Bacteroidales bacterium]|nr:hypothetical protein [Bacteroidales bacterium]